MDRKFWFGKSVLITGFEGFLGSNLTKALVLSCARIFGLDIRVGRKDTILSPSDYKKIEVIKGSVIDHKLIENIIKKNKINIAFHLAAEAIVSDCHADPLKGFSTNIQGTWNVLEACRNSGNIEAVVVASSDKAYGSHEKLPYTEKASLQGAHPYDASKSCADLLSYTYANTYGVPVAITRCGNIYGPGDFNFSRLIPDAFRCLHKGWVLKVRSDGKFVRDYVYVDDVVCGYLRIAEFLMKKKIYGESFNLSNENPITVLGLLQKINRLGLRSKLKYDILNKTRYEIKKQYLSSAKARRVLGWRPTYDLGVGLKKTCSWYFDYFSKI